MPRVLFVYTTIHKSVLQMCEEQQINKEDNDRQQGISKLKGKEIRKEELCEYYILLLRHSAMLLSHSFTFSLHLLK